MSKPRPDELDGIRCELPIRGDKPKSVGLSLSHEDAIEGISVVPRQLREVKHVSHFDRRGDGVRVLSFVQEYSRPAEAAGAASLARV